MRLSGGAWLAGRSLRLGAAGGLLWVCAADLPAMRAHEALDDLPDVDAAAQVDALIVEGRWAEAELIAEGAHELCIAAQECAELRTQRQRIAEHRASLRYRLGEAGGGALRGTGATPEALAGAIVADLLVFGDVRDLVLEAGKTLRGEPNDPVIVALSAVGLGLSAAPALDAGTATFKFARRTGTMTRGLGDDLVRLGRRAAEQRSVAPLAASLEDAATLARRAQPVGAAAILRQVDTVDELAVAARVARQPGGAWALYQGGKPAIKLAARNDAAADALLRRAARKGPEGIELAARRAPLLLRAHPLTGLAKGVWKGNVPALLGHWLRHHAPWLLGLAAAWLGYEALRTASPAGRALLRRRAVPRGET